MEYILSLFSCPLCAFSVLYSTVGACPEPVPSLSRDASVLK
jgi:hypothetical protein